MKSGLVFGGHGGSLAFLRLPPGVLGFPELTWALHRWFRNANQKCIGGDTASAFSAFAGMILPREPPRRQLGRGPIGMREVFPSGKRKEGGHYGESRNRVARQEGKGLGAVSRLAHVPLVWGVWPERGSSLGGRWSVWTALPSPGHQGASHRG